MTITKKRKGKDMAESRSDLKKQIDGLNEQVGEEQRIAYKANTNIDGLKSIISELNEIIASKPEGDEQTENADEDNGNAPISDENDSGDESDSEGDENDSEASDDESDEDDEDESDVEMRECAGNHSKYPYTKHNFPSKWGGRYSREYLISKRLLAK